MPRLPLILTTLAALTLLVPAGAQGCFPTTSEPELDVETVFLGRQYMDNDLCQLECLFSIWFYTETNGIEGLQRGDEVVDDTCGGQIESDTLTFY